MRELASRHGPAVRVRLIDVQSMVGIWKLLRHRVRRYPAVLLPGGERYCGWEELPAAEARIAALLGWGAAAVASQGTRLTIS